MSLNLCLTDSLSVLIIYNMFLQYQATELMRFVHLNKQESSMFFAFINSFRRDYYNTCVWRLDCEMTVMYVIKSMFDSIAKCFNNLYLMFSQYQAAELMNFVHLNKQVFF